MGMGGIRNEIDRVEAANVPLPLASGNLGDEGTGREGSQDKEDPLGPL